MRGAAVILESISFGISAIIGPCFLKVRSAMKKKQAGKYKAKVASKQMHKAHVAANPMPRNEIDEVFRNEDSD